MSTTKEDAEKLRAECQSPTGQPSVGAHSIKITWKPVPTDKPIKQPAFNFPKIDIDGIPAGDELLFLRRSKEIVANPEKPPLCGYSHNYLQPPPSQPKAKK